MSSCSSKTHKKRISAEWGVEYGYFERRVQLAKAHDLTKEHHKGERKEHHD